jgi:YVTN family beta-propeller protein
MSIRRCISIFSIAFVILCLLPIGNLNAQVLQAEEVTLPNGWKLTPAGRHFQLGDLPLNIAVSPNKKWLAVTNNGYGRQCIQLFDVKHERQTADVTVKMSWYGLCFSPDGRKLYASGGNENKIHIYDVGKDGSLVQRDSIVMGDPWPNKISPAGMAVCKRTNELYVATRHDYSLYVYDLKDNHLKHKEKIGCETYGVVVSKDQKKVFISCWGGEKVAIWNIEANRWDEPIKVGTHPNEMCLDKKGKRLFVANAEDNTVSVVNLKDNSVEETLNTAPYQSLLEGSTTNGLAVTKNGRTLLIANADNNCLTLFDISKPGESRAKGFIPTGWYPTNVKVIGNKFWVTDGKGLRSMANPYGPQPDNAKQRFEHHTGDLNKGKSQYIGGLFLGALSVIDSPSDEELKEYTAKVLANTPYRKGQEYAADGEPGNPIPQKVGGQSPIKHVFYVIKENRTYDQVLGDMPEGNGDKDLCIFGENITPNLHAIAREFVLLDNFYVNAEVSCDGHNWTMGAYANDYLEKTWPSNYSGRGDYYAGETSYPMGNNKSGFFWDNCQKNGVSYRTYGEFVARDKKGKIYCNLPSLKGHFCEYFEPWTLKVRDTVRIRQWIADFDSLLAIDQVPQFCTVRIGGDHTEGMRLGAMTPYAHVADNDLAVGMFLEHLSHSPIWQESVVFIIEDDAQNGPDHVDAHRSTAYICGGYVKSGFVDHTPYTTTSFVRTMELILGLPPMTQYDASARSCWRCFDMNARHAPFTQRKCNVDLNEVNTKKSRWQAMCDGYDFDKEDNVPDVEFNKALWYGLKGENVKYPPIRRSAFLAYSLEDDDDDD